MPEEIERSINTMREAFAKLPREAAVKLATEAANRAEAVADYVEMASKAEKKEE